MGTRVAIERHQTLRATIDWSYEFLSEPERQLLVRLSVFAGGFTLEAVEAVCAGEPIEVDDVLDLLATLVARSLVVAATTGADTRYRLLETIRQYGEERLAEAGETDTLRARHADHYIEFAGIAHRGIIGPGQKEWGARLAAEHDNLLTAMAFALDTEDLDRAMGLLRADLRLGSPDRQSGGLRPGRGLGAPRCGRASGIGPRSHGPRLSGIGDRRLWPGARAH